MKPYYEEDGITIYHADCRDVLPGLGKVDLVLTDPPYGIGADKSMHKQSGVIAGHGSRRVARRTYPKSDWDAKPIAQTDMDAAIGYGAFACVWGGNYYAFPPGPSWLVWDKENGTNNFADCELAWTNYGGAVRLKKHLWHGMCRKGLEPRHHPTQKPLEVILWAMQLAPKYDTILDPFMGSGTTLVAAKQLGRKAIGIELEEKYCEIAVQRLRQGVLSL